MPRRTAPKPPVEIFAFSVPEKLQNVESSCQECMIPVKPSGYAAGKLIYKCDNCGLRFKANTSVVREVMPNLNEIHSVIMAGRRDII
jgi:tRNA(Ile2) C34 agmatinyltransferase TiaS